MAPKNTEMGLDLLITPVKSQLIQVQSLEIMLEGYVQDISKVQEAGEFCEILEEIANEYLNLAEKIEKNRLVNPTIVECPATPDLHIFARADFLI